MQRQLAISYSRFSDPKQAKGDSESRQEEMFRDFCQRHHLTPVAEVFADRGRSGYKDEHRKKGRLGQLVALAKDGRLESGTVIVVEAWDRLGRLRPDRQTELVAELVRTGISIGVCRLNEIFSEEDFGTHRWTTLAVFIQLAFQESKQKADRVAAAWKKRRERTRQNGELLVNRMPGWMECANGQPRLIPERAATVKRIFQLAAQGFGHTRIVSTLTREGVPAFGERITHEGRSRSQFSGHWSKPYIALILRDRRAIGQFQPCKMDRTPDGPPIADYFPAVVSEEEFAMARHAQEQRFNRRDKKGRQVVAKDSKYVNIFKSLLRHARDGEGFLLHNKGTSARPELLLVNTSGNEGRSSCSTFPYPIFEEAVLRLLRELDPSDILPKEKQERSKLDLLRARLANVRQDISGLQAELREGFSKALSAVLRDKEAEEEKVANELQEELARSVKPAARTWRDLPGLVDLIREGGDEARLRVRAAIRQLVEEAWVLTVRRGATQFCVVQFYFTGGAHRDFLIVNQLAAFRRPGRWWARSFADVPKPGNLDLRRPEHAKRLEKVLATMNLE
jgi:DNA invertase Pin-like site-specific DNA recombinase